MLTIEQFKPIIIMLTLKAWITKPPTFMKGVAGLELGVHVLYLRLSLPLTNGHKIPQNMHSVVLHEYFENCDF